MSVRRLLCGRKSMSRIEALRREMAIEGVDVYIVGTNDCHSSENVSRRDERRAYLTGFTGSAGTAVVTAREGLLWTDGRYYLQAEEELNEKEWTLMKWLSKGVPEIEEWIVDMANQQKGSKIVVGYDRTLVSISDATKWKKAMKTDNISIKCPTRNLVDAIWNRQPERPCNPLRIHPLNLSGRTIGDKVRSMQQVLKKKDAHAMIVTALDEIAWLLNIRGSDIDFNPVSLGYVVITEDMTHLFMDAKKLTDPIKEHLMGSEQGSVRLQEHRYDDLMNFLKKDLPIPKGKLVMLDPRTCNDAIYSLYDENQIHLDTSEIAKEKALKNPQEIEGLRQSHIRDGVALTQFFAWLEQVLETNEPVDPGDEKYFPLTEVSIGDKLEALRAAQSGYVSLSFDTIAGYGSNGAIVHYKAEVEKCAEVGTKSFLLVDSGGQYIDGTTDVTRTVHFGKGEDEPSSFMRECYTRVLKGHIDLASTNFPDGVLGSKLDAIARLPLWQIGLEYRHGTGHGVGAFLNVHEGPQGLPFRARSNEMGMFRGMTISNEPGYYEDGQFGIRIESVCVVGPAKRRDDQKEIEGYNVLDTITMAPIQTKWIIKDLLSPEEIKWLNSYHEVVLKTLEPLVDKSDTRTLAYLQRETQPI